MRIARQAEASFGITTATPAQIKNRMLQMLTSNEKNVTHVKSTQPRFYDFYESFLIETADKINTKTKNCITNHTIKSNRQTIAVLKRFEKFSKYSIDFDTLNMEFYRAFTKYCVRIEKYRPNSFGKHIGNLKGVLSKAEVRGYRVNKEYRDSDFKRTREETTDIYLNEEEIKCLMDLDLSKTPGYARTRDLFVIGCYTGLRFGDYSELQKADIRLDENGTFKITVKTSKTSKVVKIPIVPTVLPTFQKFFDPEQCRFDFPKPISNQKFNEQLKEIAERVPLLHTDFNYISHINGVEVVETYKKWEMVSTHTCRRSFATNMYLRGIDVFLIMKITGHSTEREFYKYIKIEPDDNADNFLNQFNKSE